MSCYVHHSTSHFAGLNDGSRTHMATGIGILTSSSDPSTCESVSASAGGGESIADDGRLSSSLPSSTKYAERIDLPDGLNPFELPPRCLGIVKGGCVVVLMDVWGSWECETEFELMRPLGSNLRSLSLKWSLLRFFLYNHKYIHWKKLVHQYNTGKMHSTVAICSKVKRIPMISKYGNKNYYKGQFTVISTFSYTHVPDFHPLLTPYFKRRSYGQEQGSRLSRGERKGRGSQADMW